MAKRKSSGPKQHAFRNKLLLNQWLVSLLGIDPLIENKLRGVTVRPFHLLADSIKDTRLEGLDKDNLHHFYHHLGDCPLGDCPLFTWGQPLRDVPGFTISRAQLLNYEENIVRHTQAINEKRHRKVVWKYYQWLTLLFVEIYLDRYFTDREKLQRDLNSFVDRFNRQWGDYANVPPYAEDDLNKLCLQNATGSGKTLLMHVNLLQYQHYAKKYGKDKELSRVILLTPNERLSWQHIAEFGESSISADSYLLSRGSLFGLAQGLGRVDVLEITKLADQEGPNTIATRSLGDQNLLLVDEGHRGMSGKEEGVWFTRRSDLCAKGFTFEYSATFEQAVQASGNIDFENSYAKTIVFDYSYRWFYEDGFGKDYQILNLPESFNETKTVYLTACLLKFYQQLRIYEEKSKEFDAFNLENPLWVFVGSTVSSAKGTNDEKNVVTDVAQIIQFIADFLDNNQEAIRRIQEILTGNGQDTGLLDKDGNDIFAGSFSYLASKLNSGETGDAIYRDILLRLFNNAAGGTLTLERIRGESGEVALKTGTSEIPFGLINVGDAKGLCDHVAEVSTRNGIKLTIEDSDFSEAMFASVKDSTSPINLLIGSKKFVEGWDCWRVSTMGLMHVGKSEGTQIIQLFGRGVRLKGYEWSLKRSGHTHAPVRPGYIEDLETLNVFGIEADFMEKFREFLKEEGLPGNERRQIITIPLNVTYDFGKKLKILRPKRKADDGKEYDFKRDAKIPELGDVPDYMTHNTIVADWYPRIQAMKSRGTNLAINKDKVALREQHMALINYDALFFEIVDGDEAQVIAGIQQIKKDLEQKKDVLLKIGDLNACNFGKHLFQPLFHVRRGGKITILPVALNESEYQFVTDLKIWCDDNISTLEKDKIELFLLRNLSRGKGVGFFEAGNFHPDFILWILTDNKQYVTFLEPHGLLHEGPGSEKVLFHKRIKDIERRLSDPCVVLNSFILSWTRYPELKWNSDQNELENMHVLFMTDDRDQYVNKMFKRTIAT